MSIVCMDIFLNVRSCVQGLEINKKKGAIKISNYNQDFE